MFFKKKLTDKSATKIIKELIVYNPRIEEMANLFWFSEHVNLNGFIALNISLMRMISGIIHGVAGNDIITSGIKENLLKGSFSEEQKRELDKLLGNIDKNIKAFAPVSILNLSEVDFDTLIRPMVSGFYIRTTPLPSQVPISDIKLTQILFAERVNDAIEYYKKRLAKYKV